MHRLFIIAASLVAGGLVSCEKKEPPPKELIRPVRFVKVLSTGSGRSRTFSGTSQAGISSVLSFKVNGTINNVSVKTGDSVDKGQLIATLDPKDFELQVQEARAAVVQAQAQARNAKASYDRVRALYENQNVPKSDLDTARAGYETAQASATSASKRLELARRQLDYCSLKSPEKGAIANVMVEVNENVAPGTPVVNLTAGSEPEVKIQVPEILIALVQKGAPVTVRFDALPGQDFGAKVSEVGVAPVSGATTFPVTVRLDKADPTIRPGLAAEVALEFPSTDERERFIVPPVSVGADHEGKFVFIVKATEAGFGQVSRRTVEIGELTTEGLEIFEGLQDGELLVTAGVSRIRDGQKVRLPTQAE